MRITARSMQFFNFSAEQQNVTERTEAVFLHSPYKNYLQ